MKNIRRDRIKVNHPFYEDCRDGFNLPYVFIFIKPERTEINPEMKLEYERREKIVEANGGRMCKSKHDACTTPLPSFQSWEFKDCIKAVEKLRRFKIVSHWNGVGCWTLSIGCVLRRRKNAKTKRK